MYSNSLLLKQESTKVKWFYEDIKPDVHYISVKNDLSDLVDKVKWLRENDELAQNITRQARKLVISRLMPERIQADVLQMLREYAQYQALSLNWK